MFLSENTVFIKNRSKYDITNMQEIFDLNNMVTITNSVYLVSVDNNVMAGKIGLVND